MFGVVDLLGAIWTGLALRRAVAFRVVSCARIAFMASGGPTTGYGRLFRRTLRADGTRDSPAIAH